MKKIILILGMLLLMIGIVHASTCVDSDGKVVFYFKGDFEKLENVDFFGIAGQFLELFA